MRTFSQILWRQVYRVYLPTVILCVTGLLLAHWKFDHEFPTERRILLYSSVFLAVMGISTLWNTWDLWRLSKTHND
jgi:hypothetical protein